MAAAAAAVAGDVEAAKVQEPMEAELEAPADAAACEGQAASASHPQGAAPWSRARRFLVAGLTGSTLVLVVLAGVVAWPTISRQTAPTSAAAAEVPNNAMEELRRSAQQVRAEVSTATVACNYGPPPALWRASTEGPPLSVKVLTYNLFWWNLFGLRGGNGGSAGKLIARAMQPAPFDFMGFQECDSGARVLGDAGLLNQFQVVQGTHQKCMAFRRGAWVMLDHGDIDTSADVPWNSYGTRGSQWLRARHVDTQRTVFFMNHHGPLSVNSGGKCGGEVTAHSMMHVIARNAAVGDAVILVGDFNANGASLTIQELRKYMLHVFNGDVFGGVDNIFSNVPSSQIVSTEKLGAGGSDHEALAAQVQLGPPPPAHEEADALRAVSALSGRGAPRDSWSSFWCGLEENNFEYTMVGTGWEYTIPNMANPDWCCRLCQREARCQAWIWKKNGSPQGRGPGQCLLKSGTHVGKVPKAGVVSGLPAVTAAALAAAAPQMQALP